MSLMFSIVVNTYNRAASLARTLTALRYLRYPAFEIIVVNGPSTDNTEEILEHWKDDIKIGRCAETNLARSRNVGIGLAGGDIVCFIDDDGIPEPDWLDALAAAYQSDPGLGAAGGFVRDHSGVDYQCRYIVCDRYGNASFYDRPEQVCTEEGPFPWRYPSLIGVNSSFRRAALLQIGGFDEEYAYFLDETDVCLRLVDAGWKIRFIPEAEVHHKYAASHLRNEKKVPTSLFYTTRSKVYFAFRNAAPGADAKSLFAQAITVRRQIAWDVDNLRRLGIIDAARRDSLHADIQRGFAEGIKDAFAYPKGRHCPAQLNQSSPFRRHVPLLSAAQRQRLILITQDYPPQPCGGIGIFMHRLAEALAAQGHEISVITKSAGRHTVDFENGVWVHRVPLKEHGNRSHPPLPDLPVGIRNHAYTVYDEAMRIQARRGAAITLSAIWDLEAAACVASQAFINFVYLVTTYQLCLPNKLDWQREAHYREHHVMKMIAGERWLLERAQHLLASTSGIWRDILAANPGLARSQPVPVIPFGLPAAPAVRPPLPQGYPRDALTILFVGRFEERKGIDLLFEIIPDLLERYPSVHFRLAGNDAIPVGGIPLKQRFLERWVDSPWLARIHFLGYLDEDALTAEYAHCDIFVAPSRYESFGLIYLEAMRWGKPCVGALAGGIPDVLTSDCGMLPPPGDTTALLQALDYLIRHPEARQRMGEAGLARFQRLYSMQAFTARLLGEIDRVTQRAQRGGEQPLCLAA